MLPNRSSIRHGPTRRPPALPLAGLVLLALGVPAVWSFLLYLPVRFEHARARECRANLWAIANAESEYCLRNGAGTSDLVRLCRDMYLTRLNIRCPRDGRRIHVAVSPEAPPHPRRETRGVRASNPTGTFHVTVCCPNAARHARFEGTVQDYRLSLSGVIDGLP